MPKMTAIRKSVQKASAVPSRVLQRQGKPAVPLHPVLRLQQMVGNQVVGRLIQAKLKVSQPGDRYEEEADRVANAVMRMSETRSGAGSAISGRSQDLHIQRTCPECEDKLHRQVTEEEEEREAFQTKESPERSHGAAASEELRRQSEEEEEPIQAKLVSQDHLMVQKQALPEGLEEDGRVLLKELSSKVPHVDGNLRNRLSHSKGNGSPLPGQVKLFMESRFGVDFSDVRVHTGSDAIQMARDLNAAAFTNGKNIYFNSGRYNPASPGGKRLLAHELTHVIQQNGGSHLPAPISTKLIQRKPFLQPAPLQISRVNSHNGNRIRLQRQVEVHVNLRVPQKVKLFQHGGANTVFSPVSAGPTTESLIRTPTTTYPITKRRDPLIKQGRWGLLYFAPFHGGIGFHSNICYPRRRTLCEERIRRFCTPRNRLNSRVRWTLRVDGRPRSHGCVRMRNSDAARLFNAVSDGDPVRVYKRRNWRRPLWTPSPRRP